MLAGGALTAVRTRPVEVAVTGMGVVSPFGVGCDALWAAIARGDDAIRAVERFSTEPFAVHLAATVQGRDDDSSGAGRLAIDFGLTAAREAWAAARVDPGIPPGRIAVVLGTSLGTREGFHEITEAVADAVGAAGPRLTISVACTSSTNAIGLGRDLLVSHAADLVLAGGADVLTDELFAGFHALGVLSRAPCAPFSDPPGTTLGEGAGFLVLERWEQPARRGVEPIAAVLGYGLSADAFHATAPDPSGAGVARALRGALEDAGLDPSDVGYVNAHGTGTESNDAAEWRGIRAALGAAADHVPVSSSKSFLGHAQGAAGVLEVICTLLALRNGVVPPTLHFVRSRPRCPPDPVARRTPLPHLWSHGISTNSAFGGANAAIALGAGPTKRRRRPERRAVLIAGVGAVGSHGSDPAALETALARGTGVGGRAPAFRLDTIMRGVDARGLDPAAVFLTAAAVQAAAEAGGVPRGPARDRTGIVMGASQLSPSAIRDHRRSIEERGLARLSASAFTRMVLNAPAGACSRLLGLKGPTSALAAAHGAGLLAIAYAAELLAWHRSTDLMFAAGVDELEPGDAEGRAEGAGCLALAGAPAPRGAPRLAGWGLAGPSDTATAVALALEMAEVRRSAVDLVYTSLPADPLGAALPGVSRWCDAERSLGAAPSAAAAFAAVAAARQVRRGEARAALVADGGGRSAACAILITSGEDP